MIDYQLEQVTSYYKSYADQYGMEYADFLKQQVGMTEEEFVKQMTETVKQSLGQEMVISVIVCFSIMLEDLYVKTVEGLFMNQILLWLPNIQ